ncbi:hypothetical protein [Geotalea toluenoxydans]|uniref:hypothetical protein n=1 Tax=Geotalea toluenoxydans TaxID=421624 RepID=UPI000AF311CA|nr:hypothetical protein [Geotalea toluenoxydans]
MKQWRILLLTLTSLALFCASAGAEERLKMSTTTSTQDSGLLKVLLPPSRRKTTARLT